jgi:hypothetical protein
MTKPGPPAGFFRLPNNRLYRRGKPPSAPVGVRLHFFAGIFAISDLYSQYWRVPNKDHPAGNNVLNQRLTERYPQDVHEAAEDR